MTIEPMSIPLNDDSDYGLCFAYGQKNEGGLQLTFERQGDQVVTTYQGNAQHQGFLGYLHGAVITGLLDEVMSRVPALENRWGMSARLELRFRLPIKSDEVGTATVEESGGRSNIINTKAWVTLLDGRMVVEATGSYALLAQETLDEMTREYPGFTKSWSVAGLSPATDLPGK